MTVSMTECKQRKNKKKSGARERFLYDCGRQALVKDTKSHVERVFLGHLGEVSLDITALTQSRKWNYYGSNLYQPLMHLNCIAMSPICIVLKSLLTNRF